jgi:site-specific recombinase XerD
MNRQELFEKYSNHLVFRNYRPSSIKHYTGAINRFFQFCISNRDQNNDMLEYAKSYLIHRFNEGISWSGVNVDYSAIRILFVEVLRVEWDYKLVPRPRGRSSLPTVLSGSQIELMINSITNLKHKTIVILMYAAGLRLSEMINLEVAHILIDRSQLKVVSGKGGKDRLVAIPELAVSFLNIYLSAYQPKHWLIEGQPKDCPYSATSISSIIKRAAKRVGIPFSVSAHSLRYAYATHHIENGTDLVSLQNQLGHNNINTTIQYVKLCKFNHRHIKHPIQLLNINKPSQTI